MPQIVEEVYFVGTKERIARLGLTPVVGEIRSAVTAFQLLVSEKKCSQGGSAVRKLIDEQFDRLGGWDKKVSGLEWIKCKVVKGTSVCIGVAVQVSAGSDALFMGLIHLEAAFRDGRIDVGVVIVPSDKLSKYLTDRAPCMSDAKKHVRAARLEDSSVVLLAIEHDGPGPPLAKQPMK